MSDSASEELNMKPKSTPRLGFVCLLPLFGKSHALRLLPRLFGQKLEPEEYHVPRALTHSYSSHERDHTIFFRDVKKNTSPEKKKREKKKAPA